MTAEDTFTQVVLTVADKIAFELAESYGLEWDEVRSVAYVEAYERKHFLVVAAAEEPWMVETAIRRAVRTHFHEERVKAMAETDQYLYQAEYVRLFLPYMFARGDWPYGPVNEDAISEWRTGEALDTAIDMTAAFPTLREWQRDLIVVRHTNGHADWEEIAEIANRVNGDAAKKGYERATVELTHAMNVNRLTRGRFHSGPGARESISNSKASALASLDA